MKAEIYYAFNEEKKIVLCEFFSRPTLMVEEILIKKTETWIPGKSEWCECEITFNEHQELKDFSSTLADGLKEIKLKLNSESWILKEVSLSKKILEHKSVVIKYKDVEYLVK